MRGWAGEGPSSQLSYRSFLILWVLWAKPTGGTSHRLWGEPYTRRLGEIMVEPWNKLGTVFSTPLFSVFQPLLGIKEG